MVIQIIDTYSCPAEVFLQVVCVARFDRPGTTYVDIESAFSVQKKVTNNELFIKDGIELFFGHDPGATRRVADLLAALL